MLLRDLAGVSYRFDPGALCLEFAHTGGEGFRATYETLRTAADLADWMRSYLDIGIDAVATSELATAKRVREAIWQTADALVDGRTPSSRDRDLINDAAARSPLVPMLDRRNRRRWVTSARTSQALSVISRDAIDLFSGPHTERLRRCRGTNCFLLFVDTSRAGQRRWCSMERCGNRDKVRRFRSRQEGEEAP